MITVLQLWGSELRLPLEVLRGSQAPCWAVCGTCGCFRMMHESDSAPSCCAFTHWLAFEEVSGPRVLFKSRQGNWGLSACGNTHGASLKFPSEAGFILRCAGKAGDPSRKRRGIDSPVAVRRGEGARIKWGQNPRCYPRGKPACGGLLGVAWKESGTVSYFRTEPGTSLETL